MEPKKQIEELVKRNPVLDSCKDEILKAFEILSDAYSNGRKLLVCGNGGSASDSEHIVGELMKEFKLKRKVYSDQIAALKEIEYLIYDSYNSGVAVDRIEKRIQELK